MRWKYKISNFHKINADNLYLAGGIDLILRGFFELFINKNDTVVMTRPTFLMYEILELSQDSVKILLDLGVDKVIVGTKAIEDQGFLETACDKYQSKIALSLDVRNGHLALSGWKKQTNILASKFIKNIKHIGISRIIYTDINKDGTKLGPNIKDSLFFSKLINVPLVISGGISSIQDILNIKKNKSSNIEGVVVGKALYDGNINIEELNKL